MPSRKKTTSESEEKLRPIVLPIEHHIPESLPSHHISNMVIQLADDNHLKIMFFDVRPPIKFKGNEYAPLTEEDIAKAVCVASVVVTPAKLRTWIEVFNRHLDRFFPLTKDNPKEKPGK